MCASVESRGRGSTGRKRNEDEAVEEGRGTCRHVPGPDETMVSSGGVLTPGNSHAPASTADRSEVGWCREGASGERSV